MNRVEHITLIVNLNLKLQLYVIRQVKKAGLCNYSDAYIAVKGTVTVLNTGTAAASNDRNKEVVSKIVDHSLIA